MMKFTFFSFFPCPHNQWFTIPKNPSVLMNLADTSGDFHFEGVAKCEGLHCALEYCGILLLLASYCFLLALRLTLFLPIILRLPALGI
jgi:hypothetical protein